MSTGLIRKIRRVGGFAVPFLRYRLFGQPEPVLAGYKITHRCNLTCIHCPYWSRKGPELGWDGVRRVLDTLRGMGVRILILEGGEPLLWRDGRHTIADVIDAAHDRFASVCLTTNGTLSWDGLALDRVWVSLDGPERIHDSVRGYGVFKRAWQHVQKCRGRNLLVSTTIGTHNVDGAPELLELLAEESAGMTVQFYYPYGGLPDPLFLPLNQRRAALDELIRLKRKGLPVANSFAGLRQLKQPGWACEDNLLANAEPDGITFQGCYLKGRGDSQCTLCGFAAHNEMTLAFAGRLESIRNGIRIFL